ncbi:hypothetical protein LCGC14_2892080, partial [marine sediment metagenome]
MSEITILKVRQGSDEWLEAKFPCFGGSEAASMMAAPGAHHTRDELLAFKATGVSKEYSDFVLRLFEDGHKTEKKARKLLEKKLGQDLFPSVFTRNVDGLPLLSSVDGVTMPGDTIFEHKIWNEKRADRIRKKKLEPQDYWQLEHELLVTDAELVIYMCSDGTKKKRVKMKYRPVEGRREQLIAGWLQFKADLENYKPVKKAAKPEADPIQSLPALNVRIEGKVIETNLEEWEGMVMDFLGDVKTELAELNTDQDFANAAAMVKYCKSAEERLAAVKDMALGQQADVDMVFKTIDRVTDVLAGIRLPLDKQVKNRTA